MPLPHRPRTATLLPALALALAVPLLAAPGSASAADRAADPGSVAAAQRAARGETGTTGATGTTGTAAQAARAATAAQAAPAGMTADATVTPLPMPTSYPFQPKLKVYADPGSDASDDGGLVNYHEIAPRLQAAMGASKRVSTQVVGTSTQGRQLYLVTVTAPETAAQTRQQTAWRDEIRDRPGAAAADRDLAAAYKTPVWISANIHGNEWEGTDAALDYVEELASSDDPAVATLLARHRLYFSLTLNPDGRTLGTRATALGFDPNRDIITMATPEARSFVRTARTIQPLYAADFHGYTTVLQVEPCGPPHNENYEYDLFVPHGYAVARRVEDDVVAALIPGNTYYNPDTGLPAPAPVPGVSDQIIIPFRDTPSGWDDYPPVFTAQYAAYHGAISSTVELPLPRAGATQTPATASVNTAVAAQTMRSMVAYVAENAAPMLANQVEIFRRGVAGGAKQSLTAKDVAAVPGPDEWKPLWDAADDQEPVSYPRSYVVPLGARQRSTADARMLVARLLRHGIEVRTLTRDTRVGGVTYPRGSWVVDMHQPLRGLVATLLAPGSDISAKVDAMYDISAWSYGSLWGASVERLGSTTGSAASGALTSTRAVSAPPTAGTAPTGRARTTRFALRGVGDVAALNTLLEAGVPVRTTASGLAVVPAVGYARVRAAARRFGVDVVPASSAVVAASSPARGGTVRKDLKVGWTGNQDDLAGLTALGYDDLVPVDSTDDLKDVDVLWLGAGLAVDDTFRAWADAGHGIAGAGPEAAATLSDLGVVRAIAATANAASNGIVSLTTASTSRLRTLQRTAFVYPATSFSDVAPGVTVEASYAAKPLLAGHWRDSGSGDGPAQAAGRAAALSATTASGARGFVLGTAPFFRAHPRGGFTQAATALLWASAATRNRTATSTRTKSSQDTNGGAR